MTRTYAGSCQGWVEEPDTTDHDRPAGLTDARVREWLKIARSRRSRLSGWPSRHMMRRVCEDDLRLRDERVNAEETAKNMEATLARQLARLREAVRSAYRLLSSAEGWIDGGQENMAAADITEAKSLLADPLARAGERSGKRE